jgi:hypothetical protein
MNVKIWGSRGSVPAPGPETARYGGNTSCEQLALNVALRHGQAGHLQHQIREAGGTLRDIEVSAVPLVSTGGGFRGAIVFLWPAGEVDGGGAEIGSAQAATDAEGATR